MAGRKVKKAFHRVHLLVLLLIVTTLQVSGDVIVRMAIFNPVGLIRIGLFVAGGALLFGYGPFLNVAPLDFGRVVGYIVTLLDRVGSESARIVAVRVTAGTGVHTLAHQITNRVSDLDRLPSVIDAADQRLGQPQPLVARGRIVPPSEPACCWSHFATTGLPDKSENRTLCRVLSSSMQRPLE